MWYHITHSSACYSIEHFCFFKRTDFWGSLEVFLILELFVDCEELTLQKQFVTLKNFILSLPESKMIEKHGGYKFSAPVVPSSFNFGGPAPGMNWIITTFPPTVWL